ncbi:MAG: D-amino-acid transaminase [Bacillota bacterium]
MQNLVWMDGTISDISKAKISIEDRGYLFGDGVYEVIRIYNSLPFYLNAHLKRLQVSAGAIRIDIPYSIDDIKTTVQDLIETSGCKEGYIYMQLTRGIAKRDHLFPAETKPKMVIYVRGLNPISDIGAIKPQRCITLPDQRWMNCYIKTINLLPNLLARQQASEAGAIEAILYRPGEVVTEGTRSNVFAVIDGRVMTHPESNLILSGITRRIVLDILEKLSIPFIEESFKLRDLEKASEVWITSSTMEVNPVGEIDGRSINNFAIGSVCLQVMKEFRIQIADNCFEDVT